MTAEGENSLVGVEYVQFGRVFYRRIMTVEMVKELIRQLSEYPGYEKGELEKVRVSFTDTNGTRHDLIIDDIWVDILNVAKDPRHFFADS